MHPLVGRDPEQAVLRDALERMLQANGRLVLVSGEAGIGKSSLVEDLAGEAGAGGALVLRGFCYDLSTTPPYGLWLEMTDGYAESDDLPALPELLKRGTGVGDLPNQRALFDLAREFLQSISDVRPLLVILEDIHWADQASLDLLRYLARHLTDQRILLIATYRDDEVTRQHYLYRLLPSLIRESGAIRIEPGMLPSEALDALVQGRWNLATTDRQRLVDYLLEHAEGHPLFTVELLRTLERQRFIFRNGERWQLANLSQVPVPTLVQQLIESRLSMLEENSRECLEVAAVIGHQVPFDLWQKVTGLTDADLLTLLEQAIDLHLLEQSVSGESVFFVHALTREALYERILLPRIRQVHRMIAETLEETSAPLAENVAHHYESAGDERAVNWLIEAGEAAFRNHAWTVAADRFRSAVNLIPETGHYARRRGWLLYRIGHLLRYAEPDNAVLSLEQSLQVGQHIDDSLLTALATMEIGVTYCNSFEIRRGVELLKTGTELWERIPPDDREIPEEGSPTSVRGPGQYILWLGNSGNFREALAIGERYLTPDGQASRGGAGGLWGLAAAYAATGEPDRAVEAFIRERELFVAQNDYQNAGRITFSHLVLVAVPFLTEQPEERRKLAEMANEYLTRGRGAFSDEQDLRFRSSFGPVMWLDGKWNDLTALHLRAPNEFLVAPSQLAKLDREQGNATRAWEWVYLTLKDGPVAVPGNSIYFEATELQREAVKIALSQGDLETARRWLQTHEEWLDWGGSVYGRAEQELLRARLASAEGDPGAAEQQAVESLRLASDPRQPLVLIDANLFLGELTMGDERYDESSEYLYKSLQLADTCAARYQRALVRLAQARLEVMRGNLEAARAPLGESRKLFEQLGARPGLEQAEVVAAQLQKRPATSPGGLSPRELEVLALLAQGKSDKLIAEELFISHHTVMRHVSSIIRKLDVKSRAEAVAEAVRRGIV